VHAYAFIPISLCILITLAIIENIYFRSLKGVVLPSRNRSLPFWILCHRVYFGVDGVGNDLPWKGALICYIIFEIKSLVGCHRVQNIPNRRRRIDEHQKDTYDSDKNLSVGGPGGRYSFCCCF